MDRRASSNGRSTQGRRASTPAPRRNAAVVITAVIRCGDSCFVRDRVRGLRREIGDGRGARQGDGMDGAAPRVRDRSGTALVALRRLRGAVCPTWAPAVAVSAPEPIIGPRTRGRHRKGAGMAQPRQYRDDSAIDDRRRHRLEHAPTFKVAC